MPPSLTCAAACAPTSRFSSTPRSGSGACTSSTRRGLPHRASCSAAASRPGCWSSDSQVPRRPLQSPQPPDAHPASERCGAPPPGAPAGRALAECRPARRERAACATVGLADLEARLQPKARQRSSPTRGGRCPSEGEYGVGRPALRVRGAGVGVGRAPGSPRAARAAGRRAQASCLGRRTAVALVANPHGARAFRLESARRVIPSSSGARPFARATAIGLVGQRPPIEDELWMASDRRVTLRLAHAKSRARRAGLLVLSRRPVGNRHYRHVGGFGPDLQRTRRPLRAGVRRHR